MLTALTGMADLKIGKFKIWSSDRLVTLEAETPSGLQSAGVGTLYEISGPDGLWLTVRDTRWVSGERDIVACERHRSAERFDTLVERLRLAVLERRGPYVELRQARLRPNGRAGLFDADLAALTTGRASTSPPRCAHTALSQWAPARSCSVTPGARAVVSGLGSALEARINYPSSRTC
jgi:hypothetical protein